MSHRPIRTRALLPLLVAALVTLPASLALAAPSAILTAHAAKRCPRGKHCRRAPRRGRRRAASGGVPSVGQPLFNADRSLSVSVGLLYGHGGTPTRIVGLRAASVPVTCPTSGALSVLVIVQAPLRGNAFSGTQTDGSGAVRRLDGHFVSATKAVGSYQATFPDIRGGGDCETGRVSFTATR
jgi:hypothetical protein